MTYWGYKPALSYYTQPPPPIIYNHEIISNRFNINAVNGIMVAGGGLMLAMGKGVPILGKLGPILALGLGLADMTGIFTFDKIKSLIPSF